MSFKPLSISSPRSPATAGLSPKPFSPASSFSHSPASTTRTPNTGGAGTPGGQRFGGNAVGTSTVAPRTNIGLGLGVPGGDAEDAKVEVTSPQELTQFVDNLLNDLEARFDAMSTDVLSRLSSLSTRVDSLESSIADLMSGTAGGPVYGDPPAKEAAA